jgi:hypothetical protein
MYFTIKQDKAGLFSTDSLTIFRNWAYLMKVILSVPDKGYYVPHEGYSRNASCALDWISTFLLLACLSINCLIFDNSSNRYESQGNVLLKPGNYTFIRISIISVSQHSMAGNIQRNHFPRVQSLFMSTKNVCIYGWKNNKVYKEQHII